VFVGIFNKLTHQLACYRYHTSPPQINPESSPIRPESILHSAFRLSLKDALFSLMENSHEPR
ncbi:TPA: hypothetical protein ACPZN4_003848, partial [Yersinia enterocolitica]